MQRPTEAGIYWCKVFNPGQPGGVDAIAFVSGKAPFLEVRIRKLAGVTYPRQELNEVDEVNEWGPRIEEPSSVDA